MSQKLPKVIPINDLRDTIQIVKACKESDVPLIVAKNGYSEIVLMSIDLYNESIVDPHEEAQKAKMSATSRSTLDSNPYLSALIGSMKSEPLDMPLSRADGFIIYSLLDDYLKSLQNSASDKDSMTDQQRAVSDLYNRVLDALFGKGK